MKTTIRQGRRWLLALMLWGASSATAAEYIVKYKNFNSAMMTIKSASVQLVDEHQPGQLLTVNIKSNKTIPALISLLTDPNIEYVVPNAKVRALTAPVDMAALKNQWAIAKIQAEKAWAKTGNKGSKQMVVAVIDTGVDYKHKSLAPNMMAGYDFVRGNNDPNDITSSQNPGHGTHCAGIVGATGLINDGTVGMSAEVTMMPLRFLDQNGSGDLNNGIKAIDYAIANKADVISASWGAAISRSQAKPLIEAIERAEKAGVIFVVAASNDGKDNDTFEVYPAKAGTTNSIAVAASNSNDGKPSWSNYGRHTVDISAPGDGIMSTLPKDKYGNLSGTSMATPLVAGLAAFIKAQDPSLKPHEVKSLLQATGAKISLETACDCRIDALAAAEMVIDKKMFVTPHAATVAQGGKLQFAAVYGKAPFTFTSSNASVGAIDANGEMTANSEGETQVTVKDAAGNTATSYKIFVGKSSGGGGDPGEDPEEDPAQPGDCPLGNEQLCQIICTVMPDLPFCTK